MLYVDVASRLEFCVWLLLYNVIRYSALIRILISGSLLTVSVVFWHVYSLQERTDSLCLNQGGQQHFCFMIFALLLFSHQSTIIYIFLFVYLIRVLKDWLHIALVVIEAN